MSERSTYIIRGNKDGKPITASVDASSEASARNKAQTSGIAVTAIELRGSSPPAIPVVARQTQPPSPQHSAAPIWHKFVDEGQDSGLVAKLHARLEGVLTTNESVLYIGVQQKPVVNVSPDAVALTNRRVIIFRQKILGRMEMEDFLWIKLDDAKLKENILGATLTFRTTEGQFATIDHIPKAQARKLYKHSQEQEEFAMMQRRGMDLELVRAGAAGIHVNNVPNNAQPMTTAQADDPLAKMQKLKSLLDSGMITQSEFDAKRAAIMDAI